MERSIPIVRLSASAQFPTGADRRVSRGDGAELGIYTPFTLTPRSAAEHEALRCWVTTHQTMFLTIGAAAGVLSWALDHMEGGRFGEAGESLRLASTLRRASAAYTFLPRLDRAIYEGYLRPAMMGVRPAFSGVSSRESIRFAVLIKRLRELWAGAPAEAAKARAECLEADRLWWQRHMGAMRRMVKRPISLAQHEFKRQAEEQGLESTYSEFLATTLQVPEAMDDYDRFFACRREPMDGDAYLQALTESLPISDEYISEDEPFASFRGGLTGSIPDLARLSALAAG